MNHQELASMFIGQHAHTVRAVFKSTIDDGPLQSNLPQYVFKVLNSWAVKVGDHLVVRSAEREESGLKIVQVVGVDDFLNTPDRGTKYKWAVCKVQNHEYNALIEAENLLAAKIQQSQLERERRAQYEALRNELGECALNELKVEFNKVAPINVVTAVPLEQHCQTPVSHVDTGLVR